MSTESNSSSFKDFLLAEYSNIAQAHFKSTETISTFFRYYLLIMSIPISVIAILVQILRDNQKASNIIFGYRAPVSIVLFCICAIGFGVFLFITSLRMDTLLYARVVNGIRKIFYDEWDKDVNAKLRLRVLPQSPQLPGYFEERFFLPVVFVFAVMNTLYGGFASHILFGAGFWFIYETTLLFFLHFMFYWSYCNHRETAYLRSNILGIDIDGVLNKHREQFCLLLSQKSGKKLRPNDITVIPVHEDPALGVTREDERQVFNDPKYWANMGLIEEAPDTIRKLSNHFSLKTYIFTYRPWPDTERKEDMIRYRKEFLRHCGRLFSLGATLLGWACQGRLDPLRRITEKWLRQNNFSYGRLIFERGNDFSSDPRARFKNRFYLSRKKKIRFFVEDDAEKARKLSYICDVVLLLSQPYNEPNENLPPETNELRENLPSNIIRVKDWMQIYREIRRLS